MGGFNRSKGKGKGKKGVQKSDKGYGKGNKSVYRAQGYSTAMKIVGENKGGKGEKKGKGKKGKKGKGKRKESNNEDLDAQLEEYMGAEAVASRLNSELETYMKSD